jgi:hypothetical protein
MCAIESGRAGAPGPASCKMDGVVFGRGIWSTGAQRGRWVRSRAVGCSRVRSAINGSAGQDDARHLRSAWAREIGEFKRLGNRDTESAAGIQPTDPPHGIPPEIRCSEIHPRRPQPPISRLLQILCTSAHATGGRRHDVMSGRFAGSHRRTDPTASMINRAAGHLLIGCATFRASGAPWRGYVRHARKAWGQGVQGKGQGAGAGSRNFHLEGRQSHAGLRRGTANCALWK